MTAISDPYNCLSCGCCCLQIGMPPFSGLEIIRLPKAVREVIKFHWRNDPDRPKGNPCYFFNFKTGKCAIYNYRPKICREYTAGSEDCKKIRKARFIMRWQFQLIINSVSTDDLKALWDERADIVGQ